MLLLGYCSTTLLSLLDKPSPNGAHFGHPLKVFLWAGKERVLGGLAVTGGVQ